jgi:2-polyprenyl-6-methoxyphenol hydroxylase-like FAD-dependent oxidoreductase
MLPDRRRWATLRAICAALLGLAATAPARGLAEAQSDATHYDVVVIGAGPSGAYLPLALTRRARRAGLPAPKILVLEWRDQGGVRTRSVGMNGRTLNGIADLGVDWQGADIRQMKGLEEIDLTRSERDPKTGAERHALLRNLTFHQIGIRAQAGTDRVRDLIQKWGFARTSVPIKDVEGVLRQAAVKLPNVEVRYHTGLTKDSTVEKSSEGWRVVAFDHEGGRHEVLARYLVGADGAYTGLREDRLRGNLAQLLGLPPMEVPPQYADLHTSWVAGILDRKGDGWLRQRWVPDESGVSKRLKVSWMGHNDTLGVDAEVPVAQRFASAADMERWWRDRITVFGLPRDAKMIVPLAQFDVTLRRAPQLVVKDSAFLIGDAARTLHPGIAAGMQAGMRDGERFAAAYVRLEKARYPLQKRRIIDGYVAKTKEATRVLHRASVSFFPPPADAPAVKRSRMSVSRRTLEDLPRPAAGKRQVARARGRM